MNNLLRTLTESQVKSSLPDTDLKLLLTTVKEGRRHSYDSKLSDPFYESLEGLLLDLRTVTMDNRDAEAFLRPVSRTDVPDYYDYISNPMDLQTMLKKVKQKTYKSKREFKDDLDLIWSNCFTYNATETHPLRLCAKRLKIKAEKLLKNITDRKERTDPIIPDLSGSRPRPNGVIVNGRSHTQSHPPPIPVVKVSPSKQSTPNLSTIKVNRRDVPFPEMPAIVRTPSGMSEFWKLDHDESWAASSDHASLGLTASLREKIPEDEDEIEVGEATYSVAEDLFGDEGSEVGEKRKLNGAIEHRPRKRSRSTPHSINGTEDPTDLWWKAVQSDSLLANGLPSPLYTPPSPAQQSPAPKSSVPVPQKRKRPKKRKKSLSSQSSNSLLALMNTNIRAMKRMRQTHAKFAALNHPEDGESPEDASDVLGIGVDVDDSIDESPWKVPEQGSGIEIGEERAGDCLNWMGGKVLEHSGFQGTSKIALEVLAGVTSEYLLNVGRTLRFLCDKHATKMTPEEIILHTLFESGTSKVQDLERYIKDDVIRYGSRLADLEKKLVGAYREATAVEALDDDALFRIDEDEEEDGAFVMGNFADALGDDFLGLRELGIASEFGLSSLSVPKKLLKGKNKRNEPNAAAAKPTEPPPPFPPPPPFIPLDSVKVDDQIGLLKPYYQSRISAMATSIPPPPGTMQPPALAFNFGIPSIPAPPPSYLLQSSTDNLPPVILPDDIPNPAQAKMGPLGQILKPGPTAGTSKKKSKAKEPAAGSSPLVKQQQPQPSPQKGVGSGSGKKKSKITHGSLPPVVTASA